MPTCKKCNNHFSFKAIVDGKIRILANRKYCLACSPFGKHNTRKIHNPDPIKKNVICEICDKNFNYSKKKGDRLNICASCGVTRHRQKLKIRLVEYKGGKCQCCGYNKSVYSLDFHHKNPAEKEFTIGGKTISYERLKKEADKCVLICRNCHGEIHEELDTKGYSGIVNKIIEK